MRRKRFLVAAVGGTLMTGAVLGVNGPAVADPLGPTTIAGSGSDTTQNVMDAIAHNLVTASTTVGSWNATVSGVTHDPITPKNTAACTSIPRPNGSIEGVTALRRSGCFDFARSSIGPGANASTSGLLQYVPFALDGVTMAVGPASGADATAIGGSFTLAQLRTMYSTGAAVVASDRATYDPNPADGITGTAIHLLIPRAGSGTRSFFATAMFINATTPPAWVSDTFTPTGGGAPEPVQPNNGIAVQRDHNAIMPFSTAQFIGQARGHDDRRNGARLQTVDGVAPIAGGELNTAFPGDLLREVYNVIPFSATTATGTPLYNVFVSANTNSPLRLCNQSSLITEYGFALLDDAPKGHTCGQIAPELRAYAADTR